tara:strand:- start:2921 stop:3886 length:966 start_codon:yes stop_codon:yes gene_type:complete
MNNKKLAPICLFVYDRIDETRQTILALKNNFLAKSSELFIFSDGWNNVETREKILALRIFLNEIKGFKKISIFESAVNKGLAKSIIDGVTLVLEKNAKVIVLEDDLITTPNFLDFMNKSLNFYEDHKDIQSISGYSLKIKRKSHNSDIYFSRRPHSWSWATWSKNWHKDLFDTNELKEDLTKNKLMLFKEICGQDISEMLVNSIVGLNDSWYVRWVYNHFKNEKYSVYPYYSKVKNIGFSDNGTHCHGINVYVSEMDLGLNRNFNFIDYTKNLKSEKEFLTYFSLKYKLKFRIRLLFNNEGRKLLREEISRIIIRKYERVF